MVDLDRPWSTMVDLGRPRSMTESLPSFGLSVLHGLAAFTTIFSDDGLDIFVVFSVSLSAVKGAQEDMASAITTVMGYGVLLSVG